MTTTVPILLYHGVAAEGPDGLAPYVMAPERFAEHMAELDRRRCSLLTVSTLVDLMKRGEEPPPRAVVVTFDDGLADFADHAWPVLRGLGFPATLYVVSGRVGGRAEWLAEFGEPVPSMLTVDQVRTLADEGCEIGAHSVSHPELDTLSAEALIHEVRGSRVELSLALERPVRSFAYPHGYHDRRVREAVRLAGFDSACAVRNMLSSTSDDPFALARVTITADQTVDHLRRVLDGQGLKRAPRPEQVRTLGWRVYRRTRRRLSSPS
ncbi:MAG: polysaccharide deacetylase [Acidimicrobiales bacterium]|nr:polysaccharide deacetylase [Acidimicrobiales bacterium]